MAQRLKATFHDGAFIPQQHCDFADGAEVEIVVYDATLLPAQEQDPEEKSRILNEVVESMRQNPFPPNSPRFTREDMHERR
jgi:predicted DNA-binding antitoxin AbrB/MazE fold protein